MSQNEAIGIIAAIKENTAVQRLVLAELRELRADLQKQPTELAAETLAVVAALEEIKTKLNRI